MFLGAVKEKMMVVIMLIVTLITTNSFNAKTKLCSQLPELLEAVNIGGSEGLQGLHLVVT